ncbi:unnamed protein product, partial [Iphiclides podalirius]
MQKDFEIKPSVHSMWETRVQFPTRDTSRLGRKVARYEDRTTCSRAGRAPWRALEPYRLHAPRPPIGANEDLCGTI